MRQHWEGAVFEVVGLVAAEPAAAVVAAAVAVEMVVGVVAAAWPLWFAEHWRRQRPPCSWPIPHLHWLV